MISCPTLLCEDPDPSLPSSHDLCYLHDGLQPTEYIRMHPCDWYSNNSASQIRSEDVVIPRSCEFDRLNDIYAWVDETHQQTPTTDADSQLMNRRTEAYCRETTSFEGMLNNGRSCKNSYQCKSKICTNGKCDGLYKGQTCNHHENCDAQLFCKKSTEWPYTSECSELRRPYETCNETYECAPSAFCWYATPSDASEDTKSCLPLYSQSLGVAFGWKEVSVGQDTPTLEDIKHNGQYCSSGLAYKIVNEETGVSEAKCSQVEKVSFDGEDILSPYKCDPTNTEKMCHYHFISHEIIADELTQRSIDTTESTEQGTSNEEPEFEVDGTYEEHCRCAMDGDSGYCGTVLGTDIYTQNISLVKEMLLKSACHTLDRDNLRAQKDTCGQGIL